MFTYIVPFVNSFSRFEEQIKKISSVDIVEKIVIVNNGNEMYRPIFSRDKIQVINNLNPEEKSYCNGAWNQGYLASDTEYIMVGTEDIIFDVGIFQRLIEFFETTDAQIIGTQQDIMGNSENGTDFSKVNIERIQKRSYAYGLFMAMRRKDYNLIPTEYIKHWWGDDFLFYSLTNKYHLIGEFRVETVLNSCSQDDKTKSIIKSDHDWGDIVIDLVKSDKWNYKTNKI